MLFVSCPANLPDSPSISHIKPVGFCNKKTEFLKHVSNYQREIHPTKHTSRPLKPILLCFLDFEIDPTTAPVPGSRSERKWEKLEKKQCPKSLSSDRTGVCVPCFAEFAHCQIPTPETLGSTLVQRSTRDVLIAF